MYNFITNFISQYGMAIAYAALTAIAGVAAAFVKKKYNEWASTKTKKEVVKTVVMAVQQLYKDMNSDEKKQKAIEGIVAMLAEKGIEISELEIDMLIEAAVGEFKGVFDDTEEMVTEPVVVTGFAPEPIEYVLDDEDEDEDEDDDEEEE